MIQLASTLRNLGRPEESAELLRAELAAYPEHELSDAARAFLALALHDLGRHDEAIATAVGALAPHLPLYRRAVERYAHDLTTR